MRRRTFIQLFASVPAVVMAQRAIPAVLGDPQVIKADEVGLTCVALDARGHVIARANYIYKPNPEQWPFYAIGAVFTLGTLKNVRVDRWELRRDGSAVAWKDEARFVAICETIAISWLIE